MPANHSRAILPEPPDELKRLSQRLRTEIRATIRAHGPIPFSRYMEMALYQPDLGYYSAGLRKFGPGGDFVTAPELGHVFASCLARQVEEIAAHLGSYAMLEIGAGNGSLAADLLDALGKRRPDRYCILERSAHLRQVQRETIAARVPGHAELVDWLDSPPAQPWNGIIIANEVIDALPVERFCVRGGTPWQMHVMATETGFDWLEKPASEAVLAAVREALGERLAGLPEGYNSEINPFLQPWLASVTGALRRGCALFIDYGYVRREYYRPERSTGTLMCHYRHRAVDDPFRWPGLQDISAFVDFTALAAAGHAQNLDCAGYTNQAMFLFGCGLEDILREAEGRPDRDRLRLATEVRELTLPGAMGEKFQVLALTRDCDAELRGFSHLDLRHRL